MYIQGTGKMWMKTEFTGCWIRGVNAGGPLRSFSSRMYHTGHGWPYLFLYISKAAFHIWDKPFFLTLVECFFFWVKEKNLLQCQRKSFAFHILAFMPKKNLNSNVIHICVHLHSFEFIAAMRVPIEIFSNAKSRKVNSLLY